MVVGQGALLSSPMVACTPEAAAGCVHVSESEGYVVGAAVGCVLVAEEGPAELELIPALELLNVAEAEVEEEVPA